MSFQLVLERTGGRGRTAFLACICLLALMPGCGSSDQPTEVTEAPAADEAEVWQPSGNEGTVTGKIGFEGTAPKFRPISMDADPVCATKHSGPVYPDAVVVNDNGTLRNVFVYVKGGLEGKRFRVPDSAVQLDQNGCIYQPHVFGIQAGQNLAVLTSDDTTHNIHPIPKTNREWNVSQPPGADPIIKSFSRPEVSIPVKCNQHPWMRAYIHVMSHPFFSVSGADGTFSLDGIPPGDYELEAIHEQYGAQTMQVTVAASGSATADFSFSATQAYRASSLEMMPALVLSCCGAER